jgi:hypothetical protein
MITSPSQSFPGLTEIGSSEQEIIAFGEESLQMVKQYCTETELNDWKFLKAKTKGKNTMIVILIPPGKDSHVQKAWKKELPGASTPVWKAQGHLKKSPDNYMAAFFDWYQEAASATMAIAELKTVASIAPNLRVIYLRVRVITFSKIVDRSGEIRCLQS